ncbi:hypothetical protein SSX86_003654 [Deinandra increscens subsp. villosa]|uniref:DUF4378 domain-containing protein n=1 Tax=Deinandra increscens subsp. villosa TaxID=3103831 RepID=A0AAP0H821_9ASTR
MAGLVIHEDKRMEKQIGCMSSFLQIFDRQQILAGKRIHSAKRLPPSTVVGASPETLSSGDSPEFSQELQPKRHAAFDNQSRPRSVIARLMGLETLPSSDKKAPKTVKSPAVPRSVDAVRSKYIDGSNFQVKLPNQSQNQSMELMEYASVNLKSECSRTSGSFSHSADFPQNQTAVITTSGDFEKKLKMRGMDEQFNDLTALKQILEVLQHKGLLRSASRSNRDRHRNFIHDRSLHYSDESSIHLKQHWRLLASKVDQHRSVNDSQTTPSDKSSAISSNGGAADRSGRIPVKTRTSSPNRIESNLKTCNSIIKTKPLSIEVEIHSPIDSSHSTKFTAKKHGSVHHSIANRSSNNSPDPNFIKNVVTDDESSSISTTDSERSKWESCREGDRLLERCGKLLDSIAEMNSTAESPAKSAAVLPSPVSVLDSGYDKDDSSSPSDSIDFRATPAFDFHDENWSPKISPTKSSQHEEEEFTSDDSDFLYISEILRSSHHLQEDPNFFISIEKQLHTETTSPLSKPQRKLLFDVIAEILDRNRQLPPWKAPIEYSRPSVKQIWSEFQKIREVNIREINTGDSLGEINGWGDYPMEKSEAILDVERMIFKDLVGEAVGDLVRFSGECVFSRTRRRLVF